MGSKPSKSDYQPTEQEKLSASVALADYNTFKEKYSPLLLEMRDKSLSEDTASLARGRTNADTMQALTSKPTLAGANSVTAGGDMSQALQAQLTAANNQALGVQNQMRSNVLGTARGQAADASSGMSTLARINTQEALTRAKNRQDTAQSLLNAGVELGTAFVGQGVKNLRGGGTFFTPNMNEASDPSKRNLASSLLDRLKISQGRGG